MLIWSWSEESDPKAEEALVRGEVEDEALVQPSPSSAAASAIISDVGYISCPIGPWGSIPSIGRITTWPASKEERLRSVSCRCLLRSCCVSPAKARSRVTNGQLLAWLFSGEIPPQGATTTQKREMGATHKAMFADILNQ